MPKQSTIDHVNALLDVSSEPVSMWVVGESHPNVAPSLVVAVRGDSILATIVRSFLATVAPKKRK